MFNYNIDFIINSNEILTPSYNSATKVLDLYGIPYDKNKITAIYKHPYVAPVNGGVQFTIDNSKWTQDTYYQIRIEVVANEYYQDGSFMSREVGYGKPFIYEFKTPESSASATYNADLVAIIKKAFDSRPLIWKEGSGVITGTDPNKVLSFQFATEYFSIKTGTISKLDLDTLKWTEVGKIVKSTNPSMIQKQGFGTYDFVLRNLRVPTYEALRLYSIEYNRRPIVTDNYTQYTVIFESPRSITGDAVVGETTVSHTEHIYYIDASKKDVFEGLFTSGNANIAITTA